ncbi:permease prefix domain 1-containing protein [Paenibacillus sp. FJAT-26967]|uniref:permease prefix domain 1-containing protein n=1 Tax=Paenibacillus sp. FJAT-26967 TaxID=1729690 RepID=UPI0008385851|nr:permease prefix domain 1-containing protein [Paenibacillus sp. FJAT-26967]
MGKTNKFPLEKSSSHDMTSLKTKSNETASKALQTKPAGSHEPDESNIEAVFNNECIHSDTHIKDTHINHFRIQQHYTYPAVENYLNELLIPYPASTEEKEELKEEWRQHLCESIQSQISQGNTEEEAIRYALHQFGSPELIRGQMQPPVHKALKEAFVWLLVLIGCVTGPYLLIGARFSFLFIGAPLLVLSLCTLLYHFVILRFHHPRIQLIATAVCYAGFLLFVMIRFSPGYSADQLFTLDVTKWAGSEGLYTMFVIHLMSVSIILQRLRGIRIGTRTISSSLFVFWTLLVFGLGLSWVVDSGELSVLIRNVMLLYGFLQVTVNPGKLVSWANKGRYWLRRAGG